MAVFILSDGMVTNSYGFRVRTSGIVFTRFDDNPVMLAEHHYSVFAVIGKWNNRVVEGTLLKAEDEFDTEDPDALKIKGKVERGFIKGVSIGISFDPSKMELMPDGVWELTECELFEASICAIPSNRAALRLYASDSGKLLEENEVQLCLNALTTSDIFNQDEMKKLQLSIAALAALGFTEAPDENQLSAISTAIEKLQGQLTAKTLALEALQGQETARQSLKVNELIDKAILEGRLKATDTETLDVVKAKFVKMATADYDTASSVIAQLQPKASLSNKIDNPELGANEVKTEEDFLKLSTDKQLAFKAEHADAYAKIFA